jgi:hypothetical protein
VLRWKKIEESERVGRVNLFTGAYMAHRNPRAYGEPKYKYHDARVLDEFLLLNHLYLFEREAHL